MHPSHAPHRTLLFLIASAILALGVLVPTAAFGATVHVVDDDGMAALSDCDASDPTHDTISEAVAAAASGDTIRVCPGLYDENVDVDKAVELRGPGAGVDAATRPGTNEAVVDGELNLVVSDVVVDGFTVQNSDEGGGASGAGINLAADDSGSRIRNNIVRDNTVGIYLASSGATPTIIRDNLFETNNEPGAASGTAIYSDGAVSNVDIGSNDSTGHASAFLNLAGGPAGGSGLTPTGITVLGNDLVSDNSVVLFFVTDVTIEGNTSTGPLGSTVFLGGGNRDVDILDNTFTGGASTAVRLMDLFGSSPNMDLLVEGNELSGNDYGFRASAGAIAGSIVVHRNEISGNVSGGVRNDDENVVDAAENWWGDPSGPSDWSTGSGDAVSEQVDFFPWALDSGFGSFRGCDPQPTPGDDVLCGTNRRDIISGGSGDDLMLGFAGRDALFGESGEDALIGHTGDDHLNGGGEFDSIQGRQGDDECLLGPDGGRTSTC